MSLVQSCSCWTNTFPDTASLCPAAYWVCATDISPGLSGVGDLRLSGTHQYSSTPRSSSGAPNACCCGTSLSMSRHDRLRLRLRFRLNRFQSRIEVDAENFC